MKTNRKNIKSDHYGRYIIFLLSFLMLFSSVVQAQITRSTIGIKGGMNVVRFKVNSLGDKENRIGFHAGAFARLQLNSSFALQPELLFSPSATSVQLTSGTDSSSVKLRLRYFDMPLLASFYLTDHLSLQTGPYLSYLIRSEAEDEVPAFAGSEQEAVGAKRLNRSDFGWIGGVNYEFRSLGFGVRYLKSFTPLEESSNTVPEWSYNFPKGKRSAWQLYISLAFF